MDEQRHPISNLSAVVGKKERPMKLRVSGTVRVYTEATEVTVRRREPQGFNHTILLLDLHVTHKDGPMKGTERKFTYEEEVESQTTFVEVTVEQADGEKATAQVVAQD